MGHFCVWSLFFFSFRSFVVLVFLWQLCFLCQRGLANTSWFPPLSPTSSPISPCLPFVSSCQLFLHPKSCGVFENKWECGRRKERKKINNNNKFRMGNSTTTMAGKAGSMFQQPIPPLKKKSCFFFFQTLSFEQVIWLIFVCSRWFHLFFISFSTTSCTHPLCGPARKKEQTNKNQKQTKQSKTNKAIKTNRRTKQQIQPITDWFNVFLFCF